MEFISKVLSKEQILKAMQVLPETLQGLIGDELVSASYGFGSQIHGDLQYQPMKVGTKWLDKFIADSIVQNIVVPGDSDFLFKIGGDRLELLFCHECDIHVSGKDSELVKRFIAALPYSKLEFCGS